MSDSRTHSLEVLSDRVIELERLYLHSERTAQDLHEALLGQQGQIDQLSRQLKHLQAQLMAISERAMSEGAMSEGTEQRSIEEERPPHY